MHKLTGKQCKVARGLLKWNVYDLANHVSRIDAKRIESYERGNAHLAEWENDELVKAFRKEGVRFNNDLDVVLGDSDTMRQNKNAGNSKQGAVITLDADQSIISDSTGQAMPLVLSKPDEGDAKVEEK